MGGQPLSPKDIVISGISAILGEVPTEVDPFCMVNNKIYLAKEAHRKRTLKMSPSSIHFTDMRGIHAENPITFSDGLLGSPCGLLLGLVPCPFLVFLLENTVWKTFFWKTQQQLLLSPAPTLPVRGKDGSWTLAAGLHLVPGTLLSLPGLRSAASILGWDCPALGPALPVKVLHILVQCHSSGLLCHLIR